MRIVLLTSLPSAAIQFIYYAQSVGIKINDVVFIGEDCEQLDVFKEYSRIKGFNLYFTSDPNSEECLKILKHLHPDIIKIITTFIIKKPLLSIPRIGVVNTHAGILPQYRGIDSPLWAILDGGKQGVTTHFVDEGIDTGPIICQRFLEVLPGETYSSILERNHHLNKWQAAAETLLQIINGTAKIVPQQKNEGKQYFEMHPKLVDIAKRKLNSLSCRNHSIEEKSPLKS